MQQQTVMKHEALNTFTSITFAECLIRDTLYADRKVRVQTSTGGNITGNGE